MHPRKPNPTHDDPPRDPTIAQWFAALGPPPTGAAPPHLQAKVRARLAQYQARRGLGTWLSRLGLPAWGLVLVAGLVLSLGLNVWWGLHTLGPQAPGTQQGTLGLQVPGAQQATDAQQEAGGAAQRLHIA